MSLTVHEKGKSKVLRGVSAMRLKIKNVRDLTVEERALGMLVDFHMFRSLLNEDEQQEVAAWTRGTLMTMVTTNDKPSKAIKSKTSSRCGAEVIDLFS